MSCPSYSSLPNALNQQFKVGSSIDNEGKPISGVDARALLSAHYHGTDVDPREDNQALRDGYVEVTVRVKVGVPAPKVTSALEDMCVKSMELIEGKRFTAVVPPYKEQERYLRAESMLTLNQLEGLVDGKLVVAEVGRGKTGRLHMGLKPEVIKKELSPYSVVDAYEGSEGKHMNIIGAEQYAGIKSSLPENAIMTRAELDALLNGEKTTINMGKGKHMAIKLDLVEEPVKA